MLLGSAVRRRCRARVDALDLSQPWDFEGFCARVAVHTGRALRVVPVAAMPDGLCGVCVSTTGADYVYIMAGTTPFHREHIALHEIGHLLAGHQGGVGVGDLAGVLLPDLDPALVRAVLGRTSYTSEQEWEAEYFATLVLERYRPARRDATPAQADPAQAESVLAQVLGRIEDTWAAPRSGLRSATIDTAALPGEV